MTPRSMAVRHTEELGFIGFCKSCHDWWPITLEFWYPKLGMARCRACQLAAKREYQNAKYRNDPGFREHKKEADRLNRRRDRHDHPLRESDRKRAYYLANRERILANERARYAAKKAA